MRNFILFITFILSLSTYSQERRKKTPIYNEVNNKEIVQSVFPNAEKVEKYNDYWFKILDKKDKTIAYAMSSKDYCKNIIGYANVTPVLVLTDLKFEIKKITLLSNWESPGYVRRLENNGFFDLWNKKSLKKAKTVKIDGYTGATITAKAVEENVRFLLENGSKKLPKK